MESSVSQQGGGVELVFLGSGTSAGIPMIGCRCEVCTSSNPRDNSSGGTCTGTTACSGPSRDSQRLHGAEEADADTSCANGWEADDGSGWSQGDYGNPELGCQERSRQNGTPG